MELIDIFRVVWRRRLLVAIGTPLIMLLALVATHRVSLSPPGLTAPAKPTGVASVSALVDTPSSQLVDLQAPGSASLQVRAELLSGLLATDTGRATVARRAGLRPAEIDLSSFISGPALSTPLTRRVSQLDAAANREYVVRVNADPVKPIVVISTMAPDAQRASRLAGATIAALTELAGPGTPATAAGYHVESLGSPRAATAVPGSGRAVTAAIALVAALAWVVGIAFATGLLRAWRQAGVPETA